MEKFWQIRNAAEGSDEAELLLYGVIADYWGDVIAAEFVRDLQAVTAKQLRVRINSVGGSLFAGIAIYNALRAHPADVSTVVEGLAASAASVVAMAGRVVMRRGSMMMVHAPSAVAVGTSEDMRAAAEMLDKARDSIVGIYAEKTGRPAEELRALVDAETWLTASEALSEKLADEIDEQSESVAPQARGQLVIVNGLSFPSEAHSAVAALAAALAPPVPPETDPAPEPPAVVLETRALTRDVLSVEAPDLLDALLEEGRAAGRAEGAAAERARLQAIDDLAFVGHDALVVAAKYGATPLDAAGLALSVAQAERAQRMQYLADRAKDAAGVVVPPAPLPVVTAEAERQRVINGAAARAAERHGKRS